jgi:hypothetical protein
MALRYDINSLRAKQEGDPSVFLVSLDVTEDSDIAVPNDWEKQFVSLSVRWNDRMSAAQFATAVVKEFNGQKVTASETALVTALNTAFSANGKAFVRANPTETPALGTAANPMFVKVVT